VFPSAFFAQPEADAGALKRNIYAVACFYPLSLSLSLPIHINFLCFFSPSASINPDGSICEQKRLQDAADTQEEYLSQIQQLQQSLQVMNLSTSWCLRAAWHTSWTLRGLFASDVGSGLAAPLLASSLPNSVANPQIERHGKGEDNLRMHQLQTQIEELQGNLRNLQHQAEHWRREAEKQQTEQQRGRHKAALAFAGSPMGGGTSMGNGAQEGGSETEMQLRAQIAQLQSQLQTSTVKGSMNETMVQVSSIGGSTHTTNILDDTTPNFVNLYFRPLPPFHSARPIALSFAPSVAASFACFLFVALNPPLMTACVLHQQQSPGANSSNIMTPANSKSGKFVAEFSSIVEKIQRLLAENRFEEAEKLALFSAAPSPGHLPSSSHAQNNTTMTFELSPGGAVNRSSLPTPLRSGADQQHHADISSNSRAAATSEQASSSAKHRDASGVAAAAATTPSRHTTPSPPRAALNETQSLSDSRSPDPEPEGGNGATSSGAGRQGLTMTGTSPTLTQKLALESRMMMSHSSPAAPLTAVAQQDRGRALQPGLSHHQQQQQAFQPPGSPSAMWYVDVTVHEARDLPTPRDRARGVRDVHVCASLLHGGTDLTAPVWRSLLHSVDANREGPGVAVLEGGAVSIRAMGKTSTIYSTSSPKWEQKCRMDKMYDSLDNRTREFVPLTGQPSLLLITLHDPSSEHGDADIPLGRTAVVLQAGMERRQWYMLVRGDKAPPACIFIPFRFPMTAMMLLQPTRLCLPMSVDLMRLTINHGLNFVAGGSEFGKPTLGRTGLPTTINISFSYKCGRPNSRSPSPAMNRSRSPSPQHFPALQQQQVQHLVQQQQQHHHHHHHHHQQQQQQQQQQQRFHQPQPQHNQHQHHQQQHQHPPGPGYISPMMSSPAPMPPPAGWIPQASTPGGSRGGSPVMGTPSPMVTATVGVYPQPDQQLGPNSSARGGGGALMYPLAPPGDMVISTQQQAAVPMHEQVGTPRGMDQQDGTPMLQQGGTPMHEQVGTPRGMDQQDGTPMLQQGGTPMHEQVGTPRGMNHHVGTPMLQQGGTPRDMHPQGGTPMQQQGGIPGTPNTSLYMSVGSHVTVGSYGGSHVGSNVGLNVGSMPAGVRIEEIRPSDAANAAQQRQKETAELQQAMMKMKAEDDARRAEKEQRMREGMERLKMQEAQKQNADALQRRAEFEQLQANVAQQEKANAEAARILMLEVGRLKQVRADNERRMVQEQAQKDMTIWKANEEERRRLAEEKQQLLAKQRSVCINLLGDMCTR
jgi:hypothetical protein